MPNAFFIHGWGGTSDGIWMPEACVTLSDEYEVYAPDMPNTDQPIYTQWRDHLDSLGVNITSQDIGVGHSLGAGFWYRYLVENHQKLSHLILVAPTPDDCGIDEIKNFFEIPVDHEKIKNLVNKITIFASDNDQYIPEAKFKDLAQKLEAELILVPKAEHFSGSEKAETLGWPVLIDYLKSMLSSHSR